MPVLSLSLGLVLATLGFVRPGDPPPGLAPLVTDAVQRGSTTELRLTGHHLAQVERVVFDSAEGIEAEIVDRRQDGVRVRFKIAAKAGCGLRELRVITPGGASNGVPLRICRMPVATEEEPNNETGQAAPLDYPGVLCGSLHAQAERDLFRFAATPKRRMHFLVRCDRRGDGLDPALTVYDLDGRAVAWGQQREDGMVELAFTAPRAGDYVLQLRDVRYRGKPDFRYQLCGGGDPDSVSVFPLAGRKGSSLAVAVGGDREHPVDLNLGERAEGIATIDLELPGGGTAQARLAVVAHPTTVEAEPNDRARPQVLHPPISVSGRIGERYDIDAYQIVLTQASKLRIAVAAAQLGSSLDPLLAVEDVSGKVLAIDDDTGRGEDAEIVHSFAKGTYRIVVRSLVGHGGPDHGYLLTVAPPPPPQPHYTLRFRPDNPVVHRGGGTKMWCTVERRGTVEAAVELRFPELPPGVSIEPVRLTKANGWTSVFTVRASEDAGIQTLPLASLAQVTVDSRPHPIPTTAETGDRPSRTAWLSIQAAAPFRVAAFVPTGAGSDPARTKARIAALSEELQRSTPERRAAQAAWEKATVAGLVRWRPLDFDTLRSEQGARFLREDQHVIRVRRAAADKDNYELIARTKVQGITAIRLEAVPSAELAHGGSGLSSSGNFVLTDISLRAWPAGQPDAAKPVRLHQASASFEQTGYPIRGTLDGSHRSGWAVHPRVQERQFALWRLREPLALPAGTVLRVYLEHQSSHPRHQLGRFRLAVTDALDPVLAEAGLPLDVAVALTTDSEARSPTQAERLQQYYHGIAPALRPLREQLHELQANALAYPPKLAREATHRLAVRITRSGDADPPLTLTLEGYASGREKNGEPRSISADLEVAPVEFGSGSGLAFFNLRAKKDCALGTRAVVVRVEGKVDGQVVVEYSAPIPVTVIQP